MGRKKKLILTDDDLKEVLSEDYFYEHGLNPALKHLVEFQQQNTYGGMFYHARTFSRGRFWRFFFARDINDFL